MNTATHYHVKTAITDYQVITAMDTGNFLIEIKELLSEGWQPIGGISTAISNAPSDKFSSTIIYTQAMIKY